MKNKFTKIMTTSLLSAITLATAGCGATSSKLAKNIDKSMADFVSSINKLDYVETGTNDSKNNNIGKIVQTASDNTSNREIKTIGNQVHFMNNNISEAEIENTITLPENQNNKFQLFVLSESPYITLTSDDANSVDLNLNVKFSTDKIATTSNEIDSKINTLILKRSILMIYVNEIYNGNVALSNENKLAIGAYVNVIKENTSYLNGNRGMVKNQLSLASDLLGKEENDNLINYYIIKSGEALETRSSKLDSTIEAIDSIINIIESNLTISSNYYNTNFSNTYSNLLNFHPTNSTETITETSSNTDIANILASTLGANIKQKTTTDNSETKQNQINNTADINAKNTTQTQENLRVANNNQENSQNSNENNINNNIQRRRHKRARKLNTQNTDTQKNIEHNKNPQNIEGLETKQTNTNNKDNTMHANRTQNNRKLDDFVSNRKRASHLPYKN